MAKLSFQKIQELIKTPKNKGKIADAIAHEERLLLHCEPILERNNLPQSFHHFLGWVKTILPPDKMRRFESLIVTPIETVESTKTIFAELSKVFEAQDKFVDFEFSSPTIEQDANDYITKIADNDFWPVKGWKAMRLAACSILVVDMPDQQVTPRPEPYYYVVRVASFVDIDYNEPGDKIEYVLFKRSDDNIIAIDDEFYRVIAKDEHGEYNTLVSESAHSVYDELGNVIDGLGYLPACPITDEPIAETNGVQRRGPITPSLGNLDWFLFWKVSKKYLDLYGAWPIFVSYKSTCDYRDKDGNECTGGYINYELESTNDGAPVRYQSECPACKNKGAIGPGSNWKVDPPKDKDDVDLMENPVKIIEMSNDKLEYGVSEINRLDDEIYLNCVGYDGDVMTDQAVNEVQVSANFESKETILDNLRKNVERLRKFAMDTVFLFRYGREYYISSTIDYGQEYFFKSAADLTEDYKNAKDAGLPGYIVADLREKIDRTMHRNNPEAQERDLILSQLEPYPDMSISALQAAQVNVTDPVGFVLKLNFYTFIQQFEREQTNIIEFGSLINQKDKIKIIQSKLTEYAKAKVSSAPTVEPGAPGPTGKAN